MILLDDPGGGNIHSEGLEALGSSVLTIASSRGNISLAGGTKQSALFLAPQGKLIHNDSLPLNLEFGLALRSLPPTTLLPGGSIQYSSKTNPMAYDSVKGGYIDYYHMQLSDTYHQMTRKGGSS